MYGHRSMFSWKCCVPNVGSQFIWLNCEHGSRISMERSSEIVTQRWYCDQCRWNFCLKCCLKYSFTDLSLIEEQDYENCYFFVQSVADQHNFAASVNLAESDSSDGYDRSSNSSRTSFSIKKNKGKVRKYKMWPGLEN